MIAQGLIVYRHKNLFFSLLNNGDNSPAVLGLELLRTIPRKPKAFEKWLRARQKELDAVLKKRLEVSHDATEEEARQTSTKFLEPTFGFWPRGAYTIRYKQPRKTFGIERVYEMDLDHLIFHFDTMPLFRLDNMPPKDVFIKGVWFDHYGNAACPAITPDEYHWKVSPRPVEKSVLNQYTVLSRGLPPVSDVHELLAIPATLGRREQVRIRLLEIQVGSAMMAYPGDCELRELETYRHVDEFSHLPVAETMDGIITKAIWPLVFDNKRSPIDIGTSNWIKKDLIYLLLAAHLDDTDSLRAAAVDVSQKIMLETPRSGGVVYGLLFSACTA